MIHRVSLARCVASSSRRVQVVLHLDVEPGAAEPIADALRDALPEAILRGFADHAQRSDVDCPECGRPASDPQPHKLRCSRRDGAGLVLSADRSEP